MNYRGQNMIFKIENRKICLLTFIMVASTSIATIIQFIKGKLFEHTLNMSVSNLTKIIMILGGLIIAEVFFYYLEWKYENHLIRGTIAEQKKKIFYALLNTRDFKQIDKKISFDTNLLVNVIDSLEYDYYICCFDSIYLILRIIFVTIALIYINFYIGIIIFMFLFIPLGITKISKKKVANLENKFAKQRGYNLELYKNIFDNLKYVRILNAREILFKSTQKQIEAEQKCGEATKECKLTINALYSSLSYMLHFFVLVASIVLIYRGKIGTGMVITLLGLTEQLSMPVLSLARNITSINSTQNLRNDIDLAMMKEEVEETSIFFKECIVAKELEIEVGSHAIHYDNIQFEVGKKYLIKGRSGIGKSIFLDMITGFIRPDNGQIFYDSLELQKQQTPLNDIFFVMADNALFKKSGIYNVLLREECTDDELKYMKQFISEEQLYIEDATKLSTGEKRRILNLRGLMTDRKILIFDEPIANLDKKNSELFWKEVVSLNKTIIVVSHDMPDWVKEKFDELYDFNELTFSEKIKNTESAET